MRPEPASYAAKDWKDATVAAPAAGEMADYMDEGEPSGGAQQGADNTNRGLHSRDVDTQGAKTRAAQQAAIRGE